MTRLNLSFVAAFLVLATCALSAPASVKRDEGHGFELAKALNGLEDLPKIMDGLDNKETNGKQNEAAKHPATDNRTDKGHAEDSPAAGKEEKKVVKDQASPASEQAPPANDKAPTATEKKLYSGNFATAAPTHSVKPTSKPNALGALPIVGGLLGGTGGTL